MPEQARLADSTLLVVAGAVSEQARLADLTPPVMAGAVSEERRRGWAAAMEVSVQVLE